MCRDGGIAAFIAGDQDLQDRLDGQNASLNYKAVMQDINKIYSSAKRRRKEETVAQNETISSLQLELAELRSMVANQNADQAAAGVRNLATATNAANANNNANNNVNQTMND